MAQRTSEDNAIVVTKQILSRELCAGISQALGSSLYHAKDKAFVELYKKGPRRHFSVEEKIGGKPIEIWYGQGEDRSEEQDNAALAKA